MSQHLNSDQINHLLQSATGDEPTANGNRGRLEDARRHLKDCESCQAQLRAHKQVIENLALLKSNQPSANGPMCPPDEVWLEIAAGIANRDSARYLSHAAACDHCGPLLRQATEDFANEATPEEEKSIAELSSSTALWQQRLVVKLQDAQPALPNFPPPKDRSPSFLRSLLAPWPLAFAAALIGLILLTARNDRQAADLSAQNHQAIAEMQRLKQSILQQNTQIAELTAQSTRSRTSTTAPQPQPTGNLQVASLVLDPGLTRGIASVKRLTIPRGTEIAKITLRLPETFDGVVRGELVTAEGQKKWSQELSPPASEKKTYTLSLLLPAYLLIPNDYRIVLSRQSADGFERFATYTFRVIR